MSTEVREPLLRVEGLKKYYPIEAGLLRRRVGDVKALDDVSFTLDAGEVIGIVGESGSGKTTLGRCIIRAFEPTGGNAVLNIDGAPPLNLATADKAALRAIRQRMNMIFQDPFSSLSPRMVVRDIIAEPLRAAGMAAAEIGPRVIELARMVGLNPGFLNRYPNAFSGGQRQRICIARALATRPQLIVADEPVSALDVSIQSQIINLLLSLQKELGLSIIFISHDLSVVRHIADRVGVMYVGKLIELAPAAELFTRPRHPYTEALLSAVPVPNPHVKGNRRILRGEAASPANPPSGCYFHPRCPYAQPVCGQQAPPFREISPGRHAACHFSDVLDLAGIGTAVANGG